MTMQPADSLEAYHRHQLAVGAMFWAPTSFLFLMTEVGLSAALGLQALYFGSVVAAEVPSGWCSDRLGRVPTLRLAAIALVSAHVLFLTGGGLAVFGAAQVMLAVGYASLSGTDVALHFDLLEATGSAGDFARREARSRSHLLAVGSLSAVTGGALAAIDLRLPFAASVFAGLVQFMAASRLTEPERGPVGEEGAVLKGRAAAVRRQRAVVWLSGAVVVQVVSAHLAADLGAPHILDLLGGAPADPRTAAIVLGILAAVSSGVASMGARALPGAIRRLGAVLTLVVACAVPVAALAAMAVSASALAIIPLAGRGIAGSAVSVVAPTIVGAHVGARNRATLLSALSLAGRGVLSLVLVAIAAVDGDEFVVGAAFGVSAWLAVAIGGFSLRRAGRDRHHHHHSHAAIAHEHSHSHGDGHHEHVHDPPFAGRHTHRHDHTELSHSHEHVADLHHDHHLNPRDAE